jgi:hypothetical protein
MNTMSMWAYISKAKKEKGEYILLILITVIIKYIHRILTITRIMITINVDNYSNRKYNYGNLIHNTLKLHKQ